ncbi:ribonuclease M5 [Tuberibacillus sp. Marseille-P3662]|uniref:ribonuclease M5 n=1 Tax=Tuberibacillus sp. Marseille-P3662 TaxID=1965358 RepID=UPI00111C0572|nr:ribonuclease M5 [Tuberibacillus sp. Marseille-P3662]
MVYIKEMIVVEGKSDTIAINNAVQADTIETNGSDVNDRLIRVIKRAQHKRGVIIFTDPDIPGEKIRKAISQQVPGCKHAFITKQQGFKGRHQSLGIEHATPDIIRQSLENVYTESTHPEPSVSYNTLIENGLIGGRKSKIRRERIGEILNIGYTNGKQFYKRLRAFHVTEIEFESALKQVLQEEDNEC